MKIIPLFFLLTICYNIDLDAYYRNQFINSPMKIPLNLTNKTSQSEIPKIIFNKDIPKNSSLLNLTKSQIIISCSKFPYDEILFQYMNQFLTVKRISSPFYSELFNLLVKILFFKNAPLEEIKKDFQPMVEDKDVEYELSKEKMEYIDVIYSRLNEPKYNFDTDKYDKDLIKKYNIEGALMASEMYDYLINLIQNNKNETVLKNLKSFLFDRKEEFVKIFNYLNSNAFSLSFKHFEEFYYGRKNNTDMMKANYMCVFISPVLDLLDTKVNIKDRSFSFYTYPQLNTSLFLHSTLPINFKETNGVLTKYFTISNENLFFQYNYLFDDYKTYNLNKYQYTKPIDISMDKKLLDGKTKRKLQVCQMLQICLGLMPGDKENYKMTNVISAAALNQNLITFGRLIFTNENMFDEKDKQKMDLILRSFAYGSKINPENEYLSHLFYLEQISKDTQYYEEFFDDVKKNENNILDNKDYKDLFTLIEMNFRIILNNYKMILDTMDRLLSRDILDSIQ